MARALAGSDPPPRLGLVMGKSVGIYMAEELHAMLPRAVDLRYVQFAPAVGLRGPTRAEVLRSLRTAPAPGRGSSDAQLTLEERRLASAILERAGLCVESYRPSSVKRRMPACLRALHSATPGEALLRLEQNPALFGSALDALLIGVTRFYRTTGMFEHLRKAVLPRVLVGAPRPAVCSMGCSNGAELYTVAMLLMEMGSLHRCELVGRDVRLDATERAAEGFFDAEDARDLPAELCQRYLTSERGHRRVAAPLREAVRWEQADALTCEETGRWDLILCRNMAIYLEPQCASSLWARLGRALRPGGFLLVGRAERPCGDGRWVRVGPCTFQLREQQSMLHQTRAFVI